MIRNDETSPAHPGAFIRRNVLPAGMSVTEAADRLGVSRPALSNLLNGKASLSAEMAGRLDRAFGADAQGLLELQAAYDRGDQELIRREIAVRAFVPAFLAIRAHQIENWADNQIDARYLLPVLLRKLIHSTAGELRRIDFPGYDNSQRHGSDGFVDAAAKTPWVPEGRSFWEFGTDQRPSVKAEKDFNARTRSVDRAEQRESTFVFVTPRNWPGKTDWEKRKADAGDWKAVRAFDASDLEQWLEQSVPAQIWLSERLGLPSDGYETLEQAWQRWSEGSEPALTRTIFATSIAASLATFKSWIERPTDRPFVIAADSKGETLAFLACLFENDELVQFKDRTAIFSSPAALRKLVASSVPFIPIVNSVEAERELGHAQNRLHCIVHRPRNTVDARPDVILDLLGFEAFRAALTSMGIAEGEFDRLSSESARSPTILRRRLSKNAAIRTPAWADDDAAAKALAPIALVGAWHADSQADCKILSRIAGREYAAIEDDVARLLLYDDCPVWSAGHHRGASSKIDALFAIATRLTAVDLDRFFIAAEYVLSESDPALELPEEDRWAAALYDKTRDHSGALREGICETLVVLSVHGNGLFRHRLGTDLEGRVSLLVRKLLTPLTLEKLLSHDNDLPRYAEAAPEEFLRIVEEDLKGDGVVRGLMKPVDRGSFWGSPSRTGVLWALECLAWRPQNLVRVARVLAELSRPKIDDNWMNKPDASLQAIFRAWMPQTASTVEQRTRALHLLARDYPDIGWEVALEQVKPGSKFGHSSYRPRWRSDASGAGQVAASREVFEFSRKALDLLLGWSVQNEQTLGDLVECLQGMPDDDQEKVWALVDQWRQTVDDAPKALLRERIRRSALARRGRRRHLTDASRDRARAAYDSLFPGDPATRHAWLFADQWVQESADEADENTDYRKREERIDRLRREAMAEVYAANGFDGVRQLLATSNASHVVGHYAAKRVLATMERVDFALECLLLDGELRTKAELCLRGFLAGIEDEQARVSVLGAAAERLSEDERVRLFDCAPFEVHTWRVLDEYGKATTDAYWRVVSPSWTRHTPAEINEIVDRLLEAGRPRAAFHSVHMDLNEIETGRLKKLLQDIVTIGGEADSRFRIDPYYISEALKSLGGRSGVSPDEMAHLEFLYIQVLTDSEHGIPNLERQIAQSPGVFVEAVALAYKRADRGEDPPEWRIEDPQRKVDVATAMHRLLDRLNKIPGSNNDGRIEPAALAAWLAEVRRLLREHSRLDIGDQMLGQLLAKGPPGPDGTWPCDEICHAMEEIASAEIGKGFHTATKNARGLHWRGVGGEQERELAAKYRAWADRRHFDYPYVGGLLEGIAASYDREASWRDSEDRVDQRLRH